MSAAELEFGTDGLRGEYGGEEINEDVFERLGFALGESTLEDGMYGHTLYIGGDTRDSTPELKTAVSEGLLTAGVNVVDLGTAPTPMISWIAKQRNAPAIAITASHNPGGDNGFKVFHPDGSKIEPETEERILQLYNAPKSTRSLYKRGNIMPSDHEKIVTLKDYYMDMLVYELGEGVLDRRTYVLDSANGASSEYFRTLFERLGATVVRFADDPDGEINMDSGATDLSGLRLALGTHMTFKSSDVVGGIALDGDGDRIKALDIRSREINGNHILAAIAQGQPGIVSTPYANSGMRNYVESMGVPFAESGFGDAEVTRKLRQMRWAIGGEESGHIVDLEHLPSGDAMYVAGMLAVKMAKAEPEMTFADLYDVVELWPETMRGIKLPPGVNGKKLMADEEVIDEIDRVTAHYGDRVRTVIRPSGTEPKVRIWAEGQEPADSELIVGEITEIIEKAIS